MDSKLAVIEQKLRTINIAKIAEYSNKIKDIATMNKMMAGHYLKDFIEAYDITAAAYAAVVKLDIDAKTELESSESIAYFDKAPAFLEEKGIKQSSEARKMYIDRDEDVIKAKRVKSQSEAMAALLKNKLQVFRMSHDDVKKLAYGDDFQTGEEGFNKR